MDHHHHPLTWKNYVKSGLFGFIPASLQLWVLMRYAFAYASEGDIAHNYTDNFNILILGALFFGAWRGWLGLKTADRVGTYINAILFIAGGVSILLHTKVGEILPLQSEYMMLIGAIGVFGNVVQTFLLGHAHTHSHASHTSTVLHLVFDTMTSLAVVLVGVCIKLVEWRVPSWWIGVGMFLVIMTTLVITFWLLKYEDWPPYVASAVFVVGCGIAVRIGYLITAGAIQKVDVFVAQVIALGMVVTGVWFLKSRSSHHHKGDDYAH